MHFPRHSKEKSLGRTHPRLHCLSDWYNSLFCSFCQEGDEGISTAGYAQSCSPVRWETSVKQKRLCRSGIVRPTSPSCGSQRLFRPLGGPHILLAAAPTAPPCFRPLAAVVAVALAELGSIAGAAPPPTRCLSNYSKCASGSPLRGNRRICAVVLPSPLGNFC